MTCDATRPDPSIPNPIVNLAPASATLWAASIGGFLFQFDLTALVAALPDVGSGFAANAVPAVWVIDVFSLALMFALPASGALADRFGRRRMFACGTVVFAAASALCALAPSFMALLAGRAMQGLGGAAFTSASLALVAATSSAAARPRAFAINGTVIGVAMVVGPPLGALVAATIGWRWIFWFNLPCCAAILMLIRSGVPESRGPGMAGAPLDWPGCAMLAVAAGGVAVVLLDGRTMDVVTLALLLGTAVLAVGAFMVIERCSRAPAIDLALLRAPRFAAMCIAPLASSVGYWALLVYVPQLARGPLQMAPLAAGALLTALTLPMLLLPWLGAVLARRWPPQLFFPFGLAVIALADLAVAPAIAHGAFPVVIALLASGAGAALIQAQVTAAAVGAAPPGRAAMAAAICVTLRQLGFSLGIALLGGLVGAGGEAGFAWAFLGAGVLTLAAAGACRVLLAKG
ncbi:MAG: MFS transporter [Pseudomonadota bacterium]